MDICYVNNKVQFSGINVNRDKQCGSFDVVPGTDDERKGRSVSLLHLEKSMLLTLNHAATPSFQRDCSR